MTALFITILNMSITASVVALAVMLVRIPLKKAPKIFSYALWGVVLFRLVLPFSIYSVFSLMPTSSSVIPQDIVYSQNPAIQTGVQFIDNPVNAAINNALPTISAEIITPENNIATSVVNNATPIQRVFQIAGYVWFSVFIALLLWAVTGYMRLKRHVRYATLVRDNIFETDKVKMPFVLGFIRPKIYFPLNIDPAQQDYILKHEQTHIRRRDYLIKPFAFIVLALHWFNPILWVSYFLMSRDMEMSCDEAVLQKTSEDIRDVYSSSLLNLSIKRVSLLSPLAFGESNVKERVKNVLKFKKPTTWVLVVSIMVLSIFLVGFASNRLLAIEIPLDVTSADTVNYATLPDLPVPDIADYVTLPNDTTFDTADYAPFPELSLPVFDIEDYEPSPNVPTPDPLPPVVPTGDVFATFLELLAASGFNFEAPERSPTHINSNLSVLSQIVFIGDEILTVYEYDSIVAMERDAGLISPSGTDIGHPDNPLLSGVEITWETSPLWVKGDLLIVLYVGENSNIINLLMENFEQFAGHGYQNHR